jgi:hypothetical protein
MTETDALLADATQSLLADQDALQFDREDIRFTTPEPGLLAVELTFHNVGDAPTGPAMGMLRSAPLGAFVPWQMLDVVTVPSIAPGRSAVVRKEYAVPPPPVLGGMDRVPPDRLLVALGLGEPGRERRSRRERRAAARAGTLAPDVMGMLGLGGLYWAGNLNLFFPRRDVERHTARSLRIHPGCMNLAMFIVGTGGSDRYRFEFSGDGAAWNPLIHGGLHGLAISQSANQPYLAEGEWHRADTGLFVLSVRPPARAERGAVNVHVCQESSGREAVVEFTMDARAAGPGCYKV